MKRGSKELIEAFNEIESLIGKDKATPFEMFLQGYFLGQRDLAEEYINEVCEWLKMNANAIYWEVESPTSSKPTGEAVADMFRRAMIDRGYEEE